MLNPYVFSFLIFAGALQYLSIAVDGILTGNIAVFSTSNDTLLEAGAMRYAKDFAVLVFGVYWPVTLLRTHSSQGTAVLQYLLWLTIICALGLLGCLLNDATLLYMSGVRWLLLLHASVGALLLSRSLAAQANAQRACFSVMAMIAVANFVACLMQGSALGDIFSIGRGGVRLAGLFGASGTLAYFAIGSGLVAARLEAVHALPKLMYLLLTMALAVSSGWRTATVVSMLTLMIFLFLLIKNGSLGPRIASLAYAALPIFGLAMASWITFSLSHADRGGLLAAQLEDGGRMNNLLFAMQELFYSDLSTLLFGAGLGVGTNTAQTTLYALGLPRESVQMNILVDNTFATTAIQLGLIGSILLWVGIWVLAKQFFPSTDNLAKVSAFSIAVALAICAFSQNIFEQYYLMLGAFLSLGLDKYSLQRTPTSTRNW